MGKKFLSPFFSVLHLFFTSFPFSVSGVDFTLVSSDLFRTFFTLPPNWNSRLLVDTYGVSKKGCSASRTNG
uniref:Putative secreted peptide n=1 Tax=Anopheles braziliensis TaxID=58242 RepID=A0A2M3ZTJ6_9DIPT